MAWLKRAILALGMLTLGMLALGVVGAPAWASGKHALLIGNSQYDQSHAKIDEGGAGNWTVLPNPVKDVELVARSLRSVGWQVTVVPDGNWAEMDATIDQFSRDVIDAELVLFYFAGHGFEYDRRNYLVPVDAPLRSEVDQLSQTFVNFENLAEKLIYDGPVIFMLDACRTAGDVGPVEATPDLRQNGQITRSAPSPIITSNAVTRQASSGVRDYDFPLGSEVAILYSTGRGVPAYDAAPPPQSVSPFAYEVANLVRAPMVDAILTLSSIVQGVRGRTGEYWPPQIPFTYNSLTLGSYFAEQAPQEPLVLTFEAAERGGDEGADGVTDRASAPMVAERAGTGAIESAINLTYEDLSRIDESILIARVLAEHSVPEIMELADAGDPLATYLLGYMQHFGSGGLPRDVEAARITLEKAAAQGTPYGQLELAYFLRVNARGEEDLDRSLELYKAAAEQDYAKARGHYARLLMGGVLFAYTPENYEAGVEQLRLAAEGGYAFAFYGLWAAASSEDEKAMWIERLEELSVTGRPDADQQLCAILIRAEQYTRSARYCESAAYAGSPDAAAQMALIADNGWAGERSVEDALHWMRQALSRRDLSAGLCAEMIAMQYTLYAETGRQGKAHEWPQTCVNG